jgi:hypothetical protein
VIDIDVIFVLPPVAIQPLTEISLVVQPDANERDAEVRRALEMVAGQNPRPPE